MKSHKFFSLLAVMLFTSNCFLFSQIYDIKMFLDQCPTNDPAIDVILNDFETRLNNEVVTEFPCTEPVSSMSVEDYTQPLIYLQTLRVAYYMDRDMTNHLPWTDTTLYVWMKNGVDGVHIVDGVTGGYCCDVIDEKKFFVIGNPDEFNREFDKHWRGISGNLDFIAHEVRHTDGGGYTHTSCCPSTGCDSSYNEADLGAYGIQYWLQKSWLTGFINVGARTSHTSSEIDEIIMQHMSALNLQFRERFCLDAPDTVRIEDIEMPLGPGYNFSVLPEVFETGLEAGSTTFEITAGHDWTISDDADWLTISPEAGTGNMMIQATYTENPQSSTRTAVITFEGTGFNSQTVTLSQLAVTSAQTTHGRLELSFYPNPVNDLIHLKNQSDVILNAEVLVSDLLGHVIVRARLDHMNPYSESGLDISSVSKGVYMLTIRHEKGFRVYKIIKE